MKQKALAVVLAACALLSGCGQKQETVKPTGLYYQASGIAPGTVLLTVDGWDVPAERYFYWLTADCDYISKQYASTGQDPDWTSDADGQTLDDYIKQQALDTTVLYAVLESWADKYDCALTAQDLTDIDTDWNEQAKANGGEEAYLAMLADLGLDKTTAQLFSADYYLYGHLRELSRTAGSDLAPADGELTTYAQQAGAETVEAVSFPDAQKAQAVLDALGKDPAGDLSALAKNNKGTDQTVTFTPGDGTLPEAVETAAAALEEAALSAPVETDSGTWLVRRLSLDQDALADLWFDAKLQTAADAADIKLTDAYAGFTAASYYEKLTAARQATSSDGAASSGDAASSDNAASSSEAAASGQTASSGTEDSSGAAASSGGTITPGRVQNVGGTSAST